jgi:hypothetical protein
MSKKRNKIQGTLIALIAMLFFCAIINAQEVFKVGQLYYVVTDPIKKNAMVVPENWSGTIPNNSGSNLQLKVQITNEETSESLDNITVEIYKRNSDREKGINVLKSKKTNSSGIVYFNPLDFNPNNEQYGNLNGTYYINAYKKQFRGQKTSKTLNFLTDNVVVENINLQDETADPITVKVAIVYENFVIPQTGLKINRSFNWMNPIKLGQDYKDAMEEVTNGVVKYEIVEEIDADTTFTYYKTDANKIPLSKYEIGRRLSDRATWSNFEANVNYEYGKMISYYGFDQKRDNDEVHEVWVVTQPFSGMYESRLMGKDAFWCNSPPVENPTCDKLLTVMFFNYERSPAEAIHSFGHRFESIMMQEYGWWDYKNKAEVSQLTNFELFTAYQIEYQKYDKNCSGNNICYAHLGVCHWPPNAVENYGYYSKREVYTYANAWLNYPYVREDPDLVQKVSCDTWDCDQFKYLKWWYSFIPRYKGLNKKDGKLNNWWHYLVNYNEAKEKELELKNQQ